ncbi:MAG: TIGR02281 family clan AA aspartic protease [Candidatus Omnitrophica bacterium]|nr:TIGR02281 family clan AA aspartic protease [Candidatus Omnitrophota bacterium]
MIKNILVLSLIFFTFHGPGAVAGTIELKNGEIITADIIKETEEAVVISRQNGKFIYSIVKERIKNIRKSTLEERDRQKKKEARFYGTGKEKEKSRQERPEEHYKERNKKEIIAARKARGIAKIEFSKNRFGVVDARLNGEVAASLMVDTGASLVVVSKETAGKLGFEETARMREITVLLADGSKAKAFPITLDSVEVDGLEIENVKGAISEKSPGQGIDGLLGMSFLRYFHVRLDTKENCLILERN